MKNTDIGVIISCLTFVGVLFGLIILGIPYWQSAIIAIGVGILTRSYFPFAVVVYTPEDEEEEEEEPEEEIEEKDRRAKEVEYIIWILDRDNPLPDKNHKDYDIIEVERQTLGMRLNRMLSSQSDDEVDRLYNEMKD